jgi:hypothetical protein
MNLSGLKSWQSPSEKTHSNLNVRIQLSNVCSLDIWVYFPYFGLGGNLPSIFSHCIKVFGLPRSSGNISVFNSLVFLCLGSGAINQIRY